MNGLKPSIRAGQAPAMPSLGRLVFLLLSFGAGLVSPAAAQLTFVFDYLDPVGSGFNDSSAFGDSTVGAARRTALEQSAAQLAAYFAPATARVVTIAVSSSTEADYAAFASPGFGPDNAGFHPSDAQQRILTGAAPGVPSISWNFDPALPWSYTPVVASSAFDFRSVAMHELLHVLGVSSLLRPGAQGGLGAPTGSPDKWTLYDQYLTDAAGNRLITADGRFDPALAGLLSDSASGDIFFSGPSAMAANGGQRVALYAPATFQTGSSISHLDPLAFSGHESAPLLLVPGISFGGASRALSTVEVGILLDLGYSMAVVPEPSASAFVLGAAALLYRRRRST